MGHLEGARHEIDDARARTRDRGLLHSEIELLLCVADLHRRTGELELADRAMPVRMANLLASGAAARARALLPDAVRAAFAIQGLNAARDIATAAQLLARLLWLEGDAEGAATALGMSQAIRGAFDQGDPELRQLAAALREELGAAGYEQTYDRGAELPRDEALQRLASVSGS